MSLTKEQLAKKIHDALYDVIFASVDDLHEMIRDSEGVRVSYRGIAKHIRAAVARGEIEAVRGDAVRQGQHPITRYRHAHTRKAA